MDAPIRVGVYDTRPYVQPCVLERARLRPRLHQCPYPGVTAEMVHLLLRGVVFSNGGSHRRHAAMFVDYTIVMPDGRSPEHDDLFGRRNETSGAWTGA